MTGKANQQVNPRVAAVVILVVLILIQVVWWRGLVMKVRLPGRGGLAGGRMGPPGPPNIVGRKDVKVTTLAGAPDPGDVDGPGEVARFDTPIGIALDTRGNLYIADSRNNRIRRVEPDGRTVTLAGSSPGYEDGPVATARFSYPCGIAASPDGVIYVADTGNSCIRRIKDGMVTTFVGTVDGDRQGPGKPSLFRAPCAISYVADQTPKLYVIDALNNELRVFNVEGGAIARWQVPGTPIGILATPNTVVTVSGAGLDIKTGIVVRAHPGKVDLAAMERKPLHNITKDIPIDLQDNDGKQSDFTLRRPVALCPAPFGWFVLDGEQSAVFYVQDDSHNDKAEVIAGISRGRNRVTAWRDADGEKAKFGRLGGIVADGRGHLYVSDTSNNSIRRITLPPDLRGRQEARH